MIYRGNIMKKWILIIVAIITAISAYMLFGRKSAKSTPIRTIHTRSGDISMEFRITGAVAPRNRLEIKPQVSGRIENILVVEGQRIKKGEVIAWMSSTDRAALLDAVHVKGPEEIKKWEDIYRPTPIISPLDGFIIDRSKEPGQSVTLSDVILVMADTLIIDANIDETDLRYLSDGQKVKIFLDAYPDQDFSGTVEHIAYESQVINNVTVYEVKILPINAPKVFRAGMTATIEVTANKRENTMLLPVAAITEKGDGAFVTIKNGEKTEQRKVTTGISDGKKIEILSGSTPEDNIVVSEKTFAKDLSLQSGQRGMRGPGSMFGIGGSKKKTASTGKTDK